MPVAATFSDYVLAIHIVAVVVAFGVTFAYPLILGVGLRQDPKHAAWFHEVQSLIGRRLIQPGLGLVVIAGIYLASKWHQWSEFYIGWGMAVALLLGALGSMFFLPNERRLTEMARRDIAAAGDGPVAFGADYEALLARVARVGGLSSLLVLITVVVMTVRP